MKKIGLILSFVLLTSSVFAGVGLGIKLGANLANQSISDPLSTISTESIVAFHGGAYLNAFFGEKIGIQPEFLWSKKGSEVTVDGIKNDIDLSYIDVPILIKWQIIKVLNIHAGPQLNFLLNAEQTVDGVTEDIKEQVKNNEFAVAFGAELNLPLNINVTARYVVGVSEISDTVSDLSSKNNLLQLSVGYRLMGN